MVILGLEKKALVVFEKMLQVGIIPDSISITALLNAFSHAGMVDEALALYESMEKKYGIQPTSGIQVCVVDTLSRSGRLQEAEEFIETLPVIDVIMWKAVLGACYNQGDVTRAERVYNKICKLEPRDPSAHILLANTYAHAGLNSKRDGVWKTMIDKNIKKIPGRSHVESIDGSMHCFYMDDNYHPMMPIIRVKMSEILQILETDMGYVADTSCVHRQEATEEEKKIVLWRHSEKLALGYALLTSPTGATTYIKKNLRVCTDCHTALKLIAKKFCRKLVVRDANRFHIFGVDGKCSCNDYF